MTRAMLASLLLIAAATPALAASEADFNAAYAAAEAAEKEAGTLRNQWITTETTLKAAKQAADKGDFDAATTAAKEAEALARASIFQANSEKDRWRDARIR
jgi:predicted  nucleic acid-binding Zn-ribbon protein